MNVTDQIVERLSTYLGPNTARVAVQTFARKSLGKAPEQVTAADAPALLEALRPMLRTLVGADSTDALLRSLREEVLG